LTLSPAAAVISNFFANFNQDGLEQRRHQVSPITFFCLGLGHKVPTHIKELFSFKNNTPVDVQIQIHIDVWCCPA
jgi:hypothetical protein